VSYYLAASFGLAAVIVAVGGQPSPPRFLLRMLQRPTDAPTGVSTSGVAVRRTREPISPDGLISPDRAVALEVRDLTVDFGGLRAVDHFSLRAAADTITGLIGPNGAGKTTTFNACTGFVRPSNGEVLFRGERIERLSTAQRAQRGMGRTFQQVQLYEALSVYENVLLGADAVLAGSRILGTIVSRPGDLEGARERAAEAIDMCGLRDLTGRTVGSLSTGHRRLVEVARCLAADFKFLLLDEPSAGLDRSETSDLAAILLQVTSEKRLGILLVEHDIELVADICSQIYVMDFGRLIAHGDPATVLGSDEVRRAYLGDLAVVAEAT
jgi:ABC-type branched-subunit amino acid transport system ATPase component